MSEDEYVDEELLLDGTWGNFDGVPDPGYLKRKAADAEKANKVESGQAAVSSASGDSTGGEDKVASADSDENSADEGSEEKQVARLHFFRSKVHAKDVNRLVVASFVSRYLWPTTLSARP